MGKLLDIVCIFAVISLTSVCGLSLNRKVGSDVGEPLLLTPYLAKAQFDEARAAAEVPPFAGNIKSYAGFITVNETYNSNMYFWYFPAEQKPATAPVLVWLQGGPGASSLYGLFEENGAYYLTKEGKLEIRKTYWSQTHHVIYIDNPVGTGFSFSDDAGYSKNEVDVGNNLYQVVYQFFLMFPELRKNDFFATGESYGGKYVPALSYAIHQNNGKQEPNKRINLKGLTIGDGLCDPVHMLGYGKYLYEIGLIDDHLKDRFNKAEDHIVGLINQKKWSEAFNGFDKLLNGDLTPYKTLLSNATGFSFYFNFLYNKDNEPYGNMNAFLDSVRKSIHVGNLTYHTDDKVEIIIKDDVMQSVAPWVSVLVDNYRVLFYNGQLDIIVAYPLTLNFLKNLPWCGAEDYKTAERKLWTVNGELAGYSKTVAPAKCAGSMTEVLVRNAGHMVPQDQPVWAMDLISKFTRNIPL